ncbi:MAG: hypothetical protein AAF317_00045 [Pseudomonadota bacterium]
MIDFPKRSLFYVLDWLFEDYARLGEIISFWAMFGFGLKLWFAPEVLEGPAYTEFAHGQFTELLWSVLPFTIVVVSAIAMHVRSRIGTDLRVIAIALSTFFWISTAGAFAMGTTPTTAVYTYLAIAFGCLLSGVHLVWKGN